MEGFSLSTTRSLNLSTSRFFLPSFSDASKALHFPHKTKKFSIFASKDEPRLDSWDQMELKFGRMIGEDPKLTLAKIMGKKSNPDISYLEIEKAFDPKTGKAKRGEIEEVAFDVSDTNKPLKNLKGLNLFRPVPKKGVKFEVNKPIRNEERKSASDVRHEENSKSSVPNIILRKPASYYEEDVGDDKTSRLRVKPNLSLNMQKESKIKRFSSISLLKKPEPVGATNEQEGQSNGTKSEAINELRDTRPENLSASTGMSNPMLLEKPERINLDFSGDQESFRNQNRENALGEVAECGSSIPNLSNKPVTPVESNLEQLSETRKRESGEENKFEKGLQPGDRWSSGKHSPSNEISEATLAGPSPGSNLEAMLLGKPERSDQSLTATSSSKQEETVLMNPESYENAAALDHFLAASPIEEHEDKDWIKAEDLLKTRRREEVELISSSSTGFVVSLGSLIGFLPYRNLAPRWKFLAFESWLKSKGVDPSMYKQNLGITGSLEAATRSSLQSRLDPQLNHKVGKEISSDQTFEDVLKIYNQEKLKFLSAFVGQKPKVGVVLVDRKSRKLIFSMKPMEKEELLERKRSLMAKLSIGDVVKCCIKKITYFGIFVEVEGIPALIHQSEVSWDVTLDPAAHFRVGQIVEAKVHQLDFSNDRIFLSLKEIMPDPLKGALEALVGDHDIIDGKLELAQEDTEWTDVESLIEELQQFEGIRSVSKGRYFLSPGLAPTFQVYMALMFENQYKLLARSGNKVQEVIVETSLSKEEMKSAILACTNKVE